VRSARRQASLTAPGRFRFLNDAGTLEALGWDGPQKPKLWRYNQHYFDDLTADGASERLGWHTALIESWLAGNPPAGGTGWEPYPLSLRVVNWIKWLLQSGQPVQDHWTYSLAQQVRWLTQRLEWHLLGNHLFINAKALVFAGLYFDGPEAEKWLRQGVEILAEQLPEQVLPDGGQFELSPMYHALALEDVLDLINIGDAYPERWSAVGGPGLGLRRVAPKMRHWLRCMSHPDGDISFFNDAARDIAPSNQELERYADELAVKVQEQTGTRQVTWLSDSGYVRLQQGPAVALLDVARVGPDYLPGHAHADTLSFEFSVHVRRILVNGGTSCYGTDAQRLAERGTAWHNTVQLDAFDSSEVWSGFRVGRRAQPVDVRVEGAEVRAGHDGYAHLSRGPMVWRTWRMEENALVVADHVERWGGAALARYHLAPGLSLRQDAPDRLLVLDVDGLVVAAVHISVGRAEVRAARHAPAFGVLVDTQALWVHLEAGRAETRWSWIGNAHPVSH